MQHLETMHPQFLQKIITYPVFHITALTDILRIILTYCSEEQERLNLFRMKLHTRSSQQSY
jgi:hypothetical protein